jgi:hypothetical protein
MIVDCRWMDERFEAYCCDRLEEGERRLAESHLKECLHCREELVGLEAIDPLVKDVFRHRLNVARSPRAPQMRLRVFPVAAAALAVIAVVAAVVSMRTSAPTPVLPPIAIQAPAPLESVEPKQTEEPAINRAKPDEIRPTVPSVIPPAGRSNNGELFAVIDPAGYVRRLEDFRGYVLVVGVWSDNQPQAAQNLNQVYRTFANNASFRLLGVANGPQNPVAGVTFPIVYNYDSQLLGAKESEFVVIDADGAERLRGSLVTDTSNLIQDIRSALQLKLK